MELFTLLFFHKGPLWSNSSIKSFKNVSTELISDSIDVRTGGEES